MMPMADGHHEIEADAPIERDAEAVECADQAEAEALGVTVMGAAADVARHEALFLRVLGEFDARDAARWYDGIAGTAHWVSWRCSIAPGTAREHVRVARALRRMPRTAAAFDAAEVSYSKVRELTRLVDEHDEERMLELARHATASQLARTVSAYRACPGTQERREARARVSWHNRDDGCVQISAVLTPEQGAAVVAALEAAASANHEQPPEDGDVSEPNDQRETPDSAARRSRVEGLVEIANHYLDSKPEDRSGEDRTMVVVEVSAEELLGASDAAGSDVPAGTPVPSDVPAGTSPTGTPLVGSGPGRCTIRGHAGVEPETARRLACEARLRGVVSGLDGEPLAVGRTQRFGTRAQRRALAVRDRHCVFPGCDRSRHLKVHHVVPWYAGGPTDLDNLMLLCQRHHTAVHEGGITIEPGGVDVASVDLATARWRFSRPDGSVIVAVVHGEPQPATPPRSNQSGPGAEPPASPTSLFPIGGGEGFNLANCVEVLFNSRRTDRTPAAA